MGRKHVTKPPVNPVPPVKLTKAQKKLMVKAIRGAHLTNKQRKTLAHTAQLRAAAAKEDHDLSEFLTLRREQERKDYMKRRKEEVAAERAHMLFMQERAQFLGTEVQIYGLTGAEALLNGTKATVLRVLSEASGVMYEVDLAFGGKKKLGEDNLKMPVIAKAASSQSSANSAAFKRGVQCVSGSEAGTASKRAATAPLDKPCPPPAADKPCPPPAAELVALWGSGGEAALRAYGWERRESRSNPGNFYFWEPSTGEALPDLQSIAPKTPPEDLPPGWEKIQSRSQPGVFYFFHQATGKTQFEKPG